MKTPFIYPYRGGSRSVRELKESLEARIIRLEGSRFRQRDHNFVINWGNTNIPQWFDANQGMLNHPSLVQRVSNKLLFFQHMASTGNAFIPWFTTNKEDAAERMLNAKCKIMARTVLAGHSGEGCHYIEDPAELPTAPLYVQYVPKAQEYRVHLGRLPDSDDIRMLHIQRKARRVDVPNNEVNWQIRNNENGFIYQINNFEPPEVIVPAAKAVFKATELNFGAVDVIYNRKNNLACVLEINTAPGLTGTTVERYVEFFNMLRR